MLDMIMSKQKECDFEDCRQYEALALRNALSKKIWVHTYYTGKFNSVEHVTLHNTEAEAKAQYAVLGGTIKSYVEC